MNFEIYRLATEIADAGEALLTEVIGEGTALIVVVGSDQIGEGSAFRVRGKGIDDATRAYHLIAALVAFHRSQSDTGSLEDLQDQVANVYALHTEQLKAGAVRNRGQIS